MSKTPAEKALFKWQLQNINVLYSSMKVLILLDLSYMSRFWTQYEAWLSMQAVTDSGLRPASEAECRHTIVPIVNANSSIAKALVEMWAEKTPEEAHIILSKPDVTVTNQSDKDEQLAKLLDFNEHVRGAFLDSGRNSATSTVH